MSSSTSVTRKRKTASSSSSSSSCTSRNDPRMKLIKAIDAASTNIDKLLRSQEDIKSLAENVLRNLDLELTERQRRMDELEEEYKSQRNSKRIHLSQELDEHGYQRAVEILRERGETAVRSDELMALQDEVKMLRAKEDAELKAAIEEERKKAKKNLEIQLKLKELENSEKEAKMTAENEHLRNQLDRLDKELEAAENRLDEQRKLMRDIAHAQAQPAIVQNMARD